MVTCSRSCFTAVLLNVSGYISVKKFATLSVLYDATFHIALAVSPVRAQVFLLPSKLGNNLLHISFVFHHLLTVYLCPLHIFKAFTWHPLLPDTQFLGSDSVEGISLKLFTTKKHNFPSQYLLFILEVQPIILLLGLLYLQS